MGFRKFQPGSRGEEDDIRELVGPLLKTGKPWGYIVINRQTKCTVN